MKMVSVHSWDADFGPNKKKKIKKIWLGQNSASHECTDTIFMT